MQEFVPMKRSPESSSFISLKMKASTCCLVSRHSASARQNSSSKPENPRSTRYSQVRTWEERGMNSECCSIQRTSRNREIRMVQKILEICLSETHASGNRVAQTKSLSFQAMLIPDAKATMEKECKECNEVLKKAHKIKR